MRLRQLTPLAAIVLVLGVCALGVYAAGCGNADTSKDDASLRKALEGKEHGPMPAETKAAMDAAMKQHAVPGAPRAAGAPR